MKDHDTSDSVWGFVWGFFFSIAALIGIAIFAEGDSQRRMLRGAFVGWIVGWIAVAGISASFLVMSSSSGEDTSMRLPRQVPVVTSEKQVSVEVSDEDFDPRDLTIDVGTTVTWKFTGDDSHTVVDDGGAFESPALEEGEEWSHTFDEPRHLLLLLLAAPCPARHGSRRSMRDCLEVVFCASECDTNQLDGCMRTASPTIRVRFARTKRFAT